MGGEAKMPSYPGFAQKVLPSTNVISTEAQRSGEIPAFCLRLHNLQPPTRKQRPEGHDFSRAINPRQRRFHSAEGRREGEAATTKLPSSSSPKSCQAPKPPNSLIPNQIELA
jgi:hypothetical protein